jgi:hypothetical protein
MLRKFAIGLLAVLASSCGSSGSSTSPTPTIAQVGGVWKGTERVTAVTTSECIGQTLSAAGIVGTSGTGTFQVTQSGATLNAVATSDSDGGTTNYTGTAGANSMALNFTSCNLCNVTNARCSSGALRDLIVQADSINATVTGNSMSGTEATTYNVVVAGTSIGAGLLVVNATFAATKQ